jgi:inner membrane transporter RhtA
MRWGVVFALVAGGCWVAYALLGARAGRAFTGCRGLALAMCVATAVPLTPGIADGGGHLLAPGTLMLAAAVAVLSTVIPYSAEAEALRRLPPRVFGILTSLEPTVAAVAGLLVLHQRLSARETLAIALVVLASVAATRRPGTLPPQA